MQNPAILFTVFMSIIATGCSNPITSEEKSVGVHADDIQPPIQKKVQDAGESLVGVAPVYKTPANQIDYSQLLDNNSSLPEPSVKAADIYNQNLVSQPWESQIRNKPLSYIKSNYKFNKKTDSSILIDLIAYTSHELEVLDSAFPQTTNVDIKSIIDGDTILLSSFENSDSDTDDTVELDKSANIKISLMNIDCPEIEQPGGLTAKTKLSNFIALQSNLIGKNKPDLKIRYRTNGTQEPLALLTLDFGAYEISVNRSLVYSGACFTYYQFNQDRLMPSIGNDAAAKNKGIWAQRSKLMANDDWLMPWDFRAAKP